VSVRIVMVETTHPGNIGATARVMANMGLTQLCLVSPRSFPDPAATARAAGADHILEQARVFDSLEAAVSDCGCVIGATARRRSLAWPLLDAEQAAARLVSEQQSIDCALVFGPEACGLSNAHLDLCHAHLRIDVNEAFPSLNVATAVAVMAYEFRKQSDLAASESAVQSREEVAPMTMGEFDQLMSHMERVLSNTAFLSGPKTKLLRKIRRLLLQGVKSTQEVNILRGVLTSLEYALGISQKQPQKRAQNNSNTPT
jgi:tRNA (cytidine32/uridine32-2'-O)-methyltransferase